MDAGQYGTIYYTDEGSGKKKSVLDILSMSCPLDTKLRYQRHKWYWSWEWELWSGGKHKLGNISRNEELRKRLLVGKWEHVYILMGIVQETERERERGLVWGGDGKHRTQRRLLKKLKF